MIPPFRWWAPLLAVTLGLLLGLVAIAVVVAVDRLLAAGGPQP